MLTWAAATNRLAQAAVMTMGERKRQKPVADELMRVGHAVAGSGPSGDFMRLMAGGDSAAWQVRAHSFFSLLLVILVLWLIMICIEASLNHEP